MTVAWRLDWLSSENAMASDAGALSMWSSGRRCRLRSADRARSGSGDDPVPAEALGLVEAGVGALEDRVEGVVRVR